jgi:hypothetical protein
VVGPASIVSCKAVHARGSAGRGTDLLVQGILIYIYIRIVQSAIEELLCCSNNK